LRSVAFLFLLPLFSSAATAEIDERHPRGAGSGFEAVIQDIERLLADWERQAKDSPAIGVAAHVRAAIDTLRVKPTDAASIRRLTQLLDELEMRMRDNSYASQVSHLAIRSRLSLLRLQAQEERSEARQVIDRLTTWRQVMERLTTWPIALLILLLVLAFWPGAARRLSQIFYPFRSIKFMGAELSITDPALGREAEESISLLRSDARRAYDGFVDTAALDDRLQKVAVSLADLRDKKGFRCTVHVPDVLFAETLYQLLDYYPRGGGRGRIFSTRFGIIGRVWRLGQSLTEGKVPQSADELIRTWGMTRREADAAGEGRQSFSAVVLTAESTPVGIFYMDSEEQAAFAGVDDEASQLALHARIAGQCETSGLTAELDGLRRELTKKGPRVQIYSSR
jgi:hypothetical protein